MPISSRKRLRRFLERVDPAHQPNKPVYVGIDSGASGAISFIIGKHHLAIDIPTIKVKRGKKKKTVFVLSEIATLFEILDEYQGSENILVCLEEAQVGIPGKGNSAYNGFRVGCNYAMWPLFIVSKGYPLEEVRPSIWKKKMGLQGKDKESSRYKAMGMFPKAELHLKKHHDRAEALLLGEYLRRLIQGKL